MAINEVQRVVIAVTGAIDSGYMERNYVGVAVDDVEGARVPSSLTYSPEWAYTLIGRACDGRGVQTVGGDLMVCGKKIRPEEYIGLWRKALEDAISPEVARERFNLSVSLWVRGNLNRQKGQKRSRTDDPMQDFDGWAQHFADYIKPDADGYFEFQLDLVAPEAYSQWMFMRGYADHNDKDPRKECEMTVRLIERHVDEVQIQREPVVVPAASTQCSLFD